MIKITPRLLCTIAALTLGGITLSVGASDQPRVIGGSDISIDSVPSTVALLKRDQVEQDGNLFEAHFCGGTVIDARWVLTAAHCVVDGANRPLAADAVMVLMGSANLNQPANQPVGVSRIIVHESFTSTRDGKDVALMELEFDALAPPIALDVQSVSQADPAYIAGWGALNEAGNGVVQRFPATLQGTEVQLMAGDVCGIQYPLYSGDPDSNNICANGNRGQDTCQGDSGGPLYRITEDSGAVYSIAGITSWGIGCGRADAPGVYTRVGSYVDWILANANGANIQISSNPPVQPEPIPEPEPSALPEIVSPAPGSTLSGDTVRFQWRSNGASVGQWYFRIGDAANMEAYANRRVTDASTTSMVFSGLPVDGRRLYVQFSHWDPSTGEWTSTVLEYDAATQSSNPPASTPEIVSPAPGSVLPGGTVNFQWRSNGTPVIQWYFRIGDSLGGENYASTRIANGSTTSAQFTGLPVDGRRMFVEFSSKNPETGLWSSQNYEYNAYNSSLSQASD